MTDAFMATETAGVTSFPTWDFGMDTIEGLNCVPFLVGTQGDAQAASFAAFVNKNSIPQLPGYGTPWTDFLTGLSDFPDIDGTIRYNLSLDQSVYSPQYSVKNDQLQVTMVANS